LAPTSPTAAFKIGERANDPLQIYLSDVSPLQVNIAGIPGISVPAGFADGLPVGLQVLAKPFDEVTLLRAAYAYEQSEPWRERRPPLYTFIAYFVHLQGP